MRSEPDGRIREPWPRRTWLVVISGLLVVVVGGALLTYRSAEDEWPWSAYPNLLHACGRQFVPQGEADTRSGSVTQGDVLVRVPGDVQGLLNHGALWATDSTPGPLPGGCQMLLWVQGAPDGFKEYVLSGGP